MLHIGPGAFEVAGASKGLLLEVVETEKKERGELLGGAADGEERRLFSSR